MDARARNSRLVHCAAGTIRLNKKEATPTRLVKIFGELTAQITLHEPDVVAIEEVFFSANAKSALKLGQVRGVAMLGGGRPVENLWWNTRHFSIKSARWWVMV